MSNEKRNSYGVRIVNGQRLLQVDNGMKRYSPTENEFRGILSDVPVTREQAIGFATQADNAGLVNHTAEGVINWDCMAVMVEVTR